jgi:hypothetical protein
MKPRSERWSIVGVSRSPFSPWRRSALLESRQGLQWRSHPGFLFKLSRQGIARFSARMEFWRSTTSGLPSPKQRSVAKTSGFRHPYTCRYTARVFLRERFLALEGEGIAWMGQQSRQGIALFSVRIEFWRSTGINWILVRVPPLVFLRLFLPKPGD